MQNRKEKYFEKALNWIQRRGFRKIKAKVESFDDPKSFEQASSDRTVTPDMTAVHHGRKTYFDIALKPEVPKERRFLVSKWKLMEKLASLKDGKFYIFTPFGHRAFAERMIKKYNIQANLVSI